MSAYGNSIHPERTTSRMNPKKHGVFYEFCLQTVGYYIDEGGGVAMFTS
jgi:hypothetical protein